MNEDTKKLLEECGSGCKMAIGSMDQVEKYIHDDRLKRVIEKSRQKHVEMEEEAVRLLEEEGNEAKEPGMAATAFSWFTTEMKMMKKEDDHQVAKIMMDGCNMGIQSICEYQNQYDGAEREAKNLAKELVKEEEEFMKELEKFL